jgi:hypothetical protein
MPNGEESDSGEHATFFGVISEETRIAALETLFRRMPDIKFDESK